MIGTAVGTALLPLLSRQARSGDKAGAVASMNRALEVTLALTLPAALALAVAGGPVMLVLFGRGAFDARAAALSAQSLAAYALGLPAIVLLKVLVPAFFAHGDTGTPVRVGMAAIALNLVLNLLFMVPLATCRAGAGHQPVRHGQRCCPGRDAVAARAVGAGRQGATPPAAHGTGGCGDGGSAVGRGGHRV